MRWKLLVIASLLATLVGVGGQLALIYFLFGTARTFETFDLAVLALLLLPLLAISFASHFVYRHTARRRKLQAMATALLSIILTLAALFIASIFHTRTPPGSQPAPTPTPRNVI
ncbi:MAG: hypothetical protein M3371_12045 [Acidobacteriota bacterium]|nr:hypothetical protein [Acidobacteriota bacterium]